MSWEALFDLFLSAISEVISQKDKNHERATEALNALSSAFYATSAYYETVFSTDAQRRRGQMELAEKWDQVANLVRPFSSELWSRFNLKSRFWYEGETWTPCQIKSAKIGLDAVRRDARFVLVSKQIKPKK